LRLLDFRKTVVHITAQALLLPVGRQKRRERPPVVVAHRKKRRLTDPPRIPPPAGNVERAERLVHVGVPLAVDPGRRTPEHRPVRSHLVEDPSCPHVTKPALTKRTAGK